MSVSQEVIPPKGDILVRGMDNLKLEGDLGPESQRGSNEIENVVLV